MLPRQVPSQSPLPTGENNVATVMRVAKLCGVCFLKQVHGESLTSAFVAARGWGGTEVVQRWADQGERCGRAYDPVARVYH